MRSMHPMTMPHAAGKNLIWSLCNILKVLLTSWHSDILIFTRSENNYSKEADLITKFDLDFCTISKLEWCCLQKQWWMKYGWKNTLHLPTSLHLSDISPNTFSFEIWHLIFSRFSRPLPAAWTAAGRKKILDFRTKIESNLKPTPVKTKWLRTTFRKGINI